MNGDGRNDDDADWLLAQLANGQPSARQDPPVAPPPVATPAAAAPPAAVPPAAPPSAPRREEVLDWFSLAEPPAAPDAATRALPVIGGPLAPTEHTPPAPQPPAFPGQNAPSPVETTGASPSWNPPFTVGRPDLPASPASAPLTSVEPPVGPTPSPFAPAAAPPVPPAAAAPPVPPLGAAPPPGPVTPPAPFALTWGSGDLDNEDAIRAAFRGLAEPGTPTAPTDSAPTAAAPLAPPASEPPALQAPLAPTPPQALSTPTPEPTTDSPFAGYTSPPVARQSFTPVPTGPTSVPPTPPPAPESSPFPPAAPPRHPITPSTAPAGWDERGPFPTPPSATPGTSAGPAASVSAGTPEAPAEAPAPGPASGADFDAELWSALTSADQPATPTTPEAARVQRAAAAPYTPSDAGPAAAATPAVDPTPTERFSAFAAETVDPFSALLGRDPKPEASDASAAEVPGRSRAASDSFTSQSEVNPTGGSTPVGGTGFPFIEVRGAAGTPVSEPAGLRAEAVANRRPPFPAFASARDDEPQRPPQTGEPVDDLLAALGSGGGSGRSRDDDRVDDAPSNPFGSSTPPRGGTPPPGDDDPLDALGLGPDDDEADDVDEPEPPRAPRGRFFGRDRSLDDADDTADAVRPDDESEDASPIARQIEETGYFWNLTPDPSAPDPKAEPARDANGLERPLAFGAAGFDADGDAHGEDAHGDADDDTDAASVDFEGESHVDSEPEPEWSFGDAPTAAYRTEDAATTRLPQTPEPAAPAASATHDGDPLAALFGGAAAAASATPVRPQPTPSAPAPAATPRATTTGSGSGGSGSRGAGGSGGSGSTGAGDKRTVRSLIWVAGGLAVLLVLAGLFYAGTLLSGGGSGGAADTASTSATPSATETPVAAPTGPQPAGVHPWNTLFGGECIEPYADPWAEEFTVVDCAAPHSAQLVYRGALPGDAAAPFPGEAEIASQMGLLCTADGIIDQAAISGITDLQVQAAFPVTEEQWAGGERTYYCFANRSGGEPLTTSIAGPGPAA
jgi:hypothetical protein